MKKKTVKKVEINNLENPEAEAPDVLRDSGQSDDPGVPVSAEADDGNEAEPAEDSREDIRTKLAGMTENWQRERANFQNFKRRVEDEKKSIRKYASYDLVFDLLRVIDYFDSSVSFSENLPEEARNVIIGVEYTLKELKVILSAHGVTPINVEVGDEFDSTLMEAAERREASGDSAGTVVEILRDGWMYHDRVLRSSQVVVAVSTDEPEGESGVKGREKS